MVEEPPKPKEEETKKENLKDSFDLKALDVRGIISKASWIILFAFAPLTILVILSQYSYPGDFFYPVKRGMEGVLLAAASVNPTTKAFFHVDLADRRFSEAEKLLLARADTSGLTDLVTEIQNTKAAIQTVSDPVQKKELAQELLTKINEYKSKLIEIRTQTINQIAQQAENQPQQNGASNQNVSPTSPFNATPTQPQQNPTPTGSQGQYISPTSGFQNVSPSPTGFTPQPTQTSSPLPTPTPIPSAAGTVIADIDTAIAAINNSAADLTVLTNGQSPFPTPTVTPSPTPTPTPTPTPRSSQRSLQGLEGSGHSDGINAQSKQKKKNTSTDDEQSQSESEQSVYGRATPTPTRTSDDKSSEKGNRQDQE